MVPQETIAISENDISVIKNTSFIICHITQEAVGEWPFSAISSSPLSGIYASLRQAQIIIVEILTVWMPVPLYLSGMVIIFAFLDLAKNFSFSDGLPVKRFAVGPVCRMKPIE
jgi:hypothetical protein